MGISLSQGPFQYNRFDDYEARLKSLDEKSSYQKKQDEEEADYEDEEEDKGAGSPAKMAKAVKEEGKKSKKSSDKDEEESEEEEKESYKKNAKKDIDEEVAGWRRPSNDGIKLGPGGAPNVEKNSDPVADKAGQRAKPDKGEQEKMKKNLANRPGAYDAWRKSKGLEEANMTGAPSIKNAKPATKTNVKFDKHMGLHAPTIRTVEGVESENMARRAMNKAPNSTKEKVQAKVMENHQMDSYVRALGRMGATYDIHEKEEVAQEQLEESTLGMGLVTPVLAGKSPDQQQAPEEVSITKEVVVDFLVNENYATNEVSAEAMFHHMSDEFLLVIENLISESAE